MLETIRSHILTLPDLAKFAVVIAVMVSVPPVARRLRIPEMVGLLLFGVLLGPHVFGFFGEHRPIASFFAELGKLLLMFGAGLEIDISLFRRFQEARGRFRPFNDDCALGSGYGVWTIIRICPDPCDRHWLASRFPYIAEPFDRCSVGCDPT